MGATIWLYVNKLEESIAFYRDTLGFGITKLREDENEKTAVVLCGEQELYLAEYVSGEETVDLLGRALRGTNGNGVGCNICFEVDGVEQLRAMAGHAKCISRKGHFISSSEEALNVQDPDGYLLTIRRRCNREQRYQGAM